MMEVKVEENAIKEQSPSRDKLARRAGAVYLAYIVFIASFGIMQSHQVVWSDLAATAHNIQQSILFFRVSFVTEIVATLLFLCATWSYYVLLKPVGKNLALLLVLLNLTGVAVECASAITRFGALKCLTDTDLLHGFTADQMQVLAMLLLRVGGSGLIVANLFYGAWLFPFGWLVYKSGFIPRFWGVLLFADCFCLWICFVQMCLFPEYEKWTYPLFPIMFVAEVGTALWLVIKGDNTKHRPLQKIALAP
jgi:hypothetical protein